MITGDAKDVVLTVKDPKKEPEKTIKAGAGGSVTVFLPDYPGTVWSVEQFDKTLGKAKEEVIPGFAPGTKMADKLVQLGAVKIGHGPEQSRRRQTLSRAAARGARTRLATRLPVRVPARARLPGASCQLHRGR